MYDSAAIPVSGTAAAIQKNGNISNVAWQSRGNTIGLYDNTYDVYNQLTNVRYYDYTTSNTINLSTNINKYRQSFTYDARGNTLTQQRFDHSATPAYVDNLQYSYETNLDRLARVHDLQVNAIGHNNNGQPNSGSIYTYDANGNIKRDLYRSVTNIDYNHLDLPTLIQKTTTNKLQMLYDADGNLLRRQTYTTSSITPSETRDFIGAIEYVNNAIEIINHSQGQYKQITAGVFRHEYVIKDHLGNTRIVYTDANNDGSISSTEFRQHHYYAFGMELTGISNNASAPTFRYKFNGIERVDAFGMDFAFYRGLDPVLGRWYQVDPKAELGYNMSPYCSMGNNPISYTDPDGDWIHIAIGAGIGGIINVATHWDDVQRNPWNALGAFGIGAAAGAVTAATGGAAAGAIGLGTTGVASGLVTGGVGALAGAPIQGLGNHLAFKDPYSWKQYGTDILMGAAIGGVVSGSIAWAKGQNVWWGNTVRPNVTLTTANTVWSQTGSGTGNTTWNGNSPRPDDFNFIGSIDEVTISAKKSVEQIEWIFTKTAGGHFKDIVKKQGWYNGKAARSYYDSPLTINEIMSTGQGIPDATFKGGLNWKVPGTFRGDVGIWELGLNPNNRTIYHFLFKPN